MSSPSSTASSVASSASTASSTSATLMSHGSTSASSASRVSRSAGSLTSKVVPAALLASRWALERADEQRLMGIYKLSKPLLAAGIGEKDADELGEKLRLAHTASKALTPHPEHQGPSAEDPERERLARAARLSRLAYLVPRRGNTTGGGGGEEWRAGLTGGLHAETPRLELLAVSCQAEAGSEEHQPPAWFACSTENGNGPVEVVVCGTVRGDDVLTDAEFGEARCGAEGTWAAEFVAHRGIWDAARRVRDELVDAARAEDAGRLRDALLGNKPGVKLHLYGHSLGGGVSQLLPLLLPLVLEHGGFPSEIITFGSPRVLSRPESERCKEFIGRLDMAHTPVVNNSDIVPRILGGRLTDIVVERWKDFLDLAFPSTANKGEPFKVPYKVFCKKLVYLHPKKNPQVLTDYAGAEALLEIRNLVKVVNLLIDHELTRYIENLRDRRTA